MNEKIDNNQKALAGEFAVLSQLAARGYIASMTLGNTKNIDILINSPENNKYYKVEVKTSTQEKPNNSRDFGRTFDWQMGVKHEDIKDKGLFYCFVLLNNGTMSAQFKFFIVPSKIVADYVKKEHKFWIGGKARRGDTRKENSQRSFRLGFRGEKYGIKTPTVEDHENKWELLS